jgi:hypothetical protein
MVLALSHVAHLSLLLCNSCTWFHLLTEHRKLEMYTANIDGNSKICNFGLGYHQQHPHWSLGICISSWKNI